MSSNNPFASPQSGSGFQHAVQSGGNAFFGGNHWRSGNLLVVTRDARLPDRCVKCNAPVGFKKRMKLAWHNPAVFFGLLGGLIPYVLLALVFQKRMTVDVGICADHVAKRRNAILMGVLALFAGIGIVVLAVSRESGLIALVGMLIILASLFYLVLAPRIVWPKKITRELAWIKGVSPEYLSGLPDFVER